MKIIIIIFENFLSKHVMENVHRNLLLHALTMPKLFIYLFIYLFVYLKYITMEVTKLHYYKAAVFTGVVSHEETVSLYCQLPC